MRRILDNLQKKNKYYNELFKITSGMIYDVQNSGREEEFEMLLGKRAQVIKAVNELDEERHKIIAGFSAEQQPHIKNLLMCKEQPKDQMEKAVFEMAQENRMLLRKITTYSKNLDMQVKLMITKMKK